MHSVTKFALGMCVGVAVGVTGFAAIAQKDPKIGTTVNDPIGPAPDPAAVGETLPKDIKCTGTEGKMQMCYLYGDPAKPGPYMVKYIWWPGNFSKPHYHNNERFAYVVSGTWWVSSSDHYDPATTFPLLAGSFAADGRVALGSVGLLVLAWPLFHWVRRAGTAPADAVPEPDQG